MSFCSPAKALALAFTLSFTLLGSVEGRGQSENPNVLEMKGGARLLLPSEPSAPEQLRNFQLLTPEQKQSFYIKRNILLKLLVSGLTRPKLGRGLYWLKGKVKALKATVSSWRSGPVESAAEWAVDDRPAVPTPAVDEVVEIGASELQWETVPANLSEQTKAFVDATVNAFIANMWESSKDIANMNGIGVTVVAGAISNTTMPGLGYVVGRSLSMDIGLNVKTQEGYVRFTYDRQHLDTPGLSLDIGLMMDVMVHITDPDLNNGQTISATHVKLPLIGCFRSADEYKAWGAQLGFNVFHLFGGLAAWAGYPMLGSFVGAAGTGLGVVTAYSTKLDRGVVEKYSIPSSALRRLRLGGVLDAAQRFGGSGDPARRYRCKEDLGVEQGAHHP